jgi:MFS family permease
MPALPPPSPPGQSYTRWPCFYGWVLVAVAFITMGIGVNARTAFSLLFPPLVAEFGWTRGVTAGAFSAGFLVATLFAPCIGLLMDRVGPRVVLPLGVVLVGSGLGLASWVRQPWHLYLTFGVLVVGGSVCISYIGHALFLPQWFVRKRGLAMGIAFSGVGLGSILLFPWVQRLIGQTGWRQTCLVLAVVLLVTLLPLNLLFPRRRPEDIGLTPDGDPPQERAGVAPAGQATIVDPAWAATDWTVGKALKTARFWWLGVAYFSGLYSWYAVQVHQTKYLLDIGVSSTQAASALGWVGLTGVIGQIALGHLSDRLGREWAWTLSGLGFGLCYTLLLLLPAAPQPLVLYSMVGAQGLLGYGLAAVFGAIPAELFPGKRYGTIVGALNVTSNAGAACGPWLTGVLYDATGTYGLGFVVAMGMSVVSILAMWIAAPRKVRMVAGHICRVRARHTGQESPSIATDQS